MRIAALACVVLILFGCTMPGGPPCEEYVAKINVFLAAYENWSKHGSEEANYASNIWRNREIINLRDLRKSIRDLLAMPQPHDAQLAKGWPKLTEGLEEFDFVVGVMLTAADDARPR